MNESVVHRWEGNDHLWTTNYLPGIILLCSFINIIPFISQNILSISNTRKIGVSNLFLQLTKVWLREPR